MVIMIHIKLLISCTSSRWCHCHCTSIFKFFFLFFHSFPSLGNTWFQSFGHCDSATVSINLSVVLGSWSSASQLCPPPRGQVQYNELRTQNRTEMQLLMWVVRKPFFFFIFILLWPLYGFIDSTGSIYDRKQDEREGERYAQKDPRPGENTVYTNNVLNARVHV